MSPFQIMASFNHFKDLVEATTCQICLEEFKGGEEKLLHCMHVFCKECLQKLLDVSNKNKTPSANAIVCPTCRKITHLPEGSVDDLPHDFHYSILEEIKKKMKCQHAICGLCESRSQQDEVCVYCFHCHSGMCQTCWNKHDRHFKDHRQIKVTAATINHLMCTDHNIHFEHFCMTCRINVCTKCCIGMHLDHEICDLCFDGNEVGDGFRNLLLSSLQEASEAMTDLSINLNCFNQSVNRTRAALKRHRDHLVQLVDEKYEKACMELDLKEGQIRETALEYKKKLMNFKDSTEKLLNNSKSWLQPMQGIPQVRIMKIDELVSEVREQMPHLPVKEKLPIICFIPGNGYISLDKLLNKQKKKTP